MRLNSSGINRSLWRASRASNSSSSSWWRGLRTAGSSGSSISPSWNRRSRSTSAAWISTRNTSSCSMICRSCSMSRVPIVCVPLNIMCSNRCATPVMPGRSYTEPTLATQPAATFGSPGRGTSSRVRPLSSSCSITSTCWAPAGAPRPSRIPNRKHRIFLMGMPRRVAGKSRRPRGSGRHVQWGRYTSPGGTPSRAPPALRAGVRGALFCLFRGPNALHRAEVAQSVEHMTENHGVASSILALGTTLKPY